MKDKGPEVKARFENIKQKDFSELSEASKKRTALKACKDKDTLSGSSFGSAIECSQAVFSGKSIL